jgi:hypothetical protein
MIQINIDMTSYVSKALGGFLRGKATEALNKIDNPIVRSGLGSIANAIDPRILGAAQINDSNIFKAEYDRRAVDLYNELNQASSPSSSITGGVGDSYDWRARLRPKRGGQDRFYSAGGNFGNDYLLRPIKESNGLVWNVTPTVLNMSSANYNTHSGQGMQYPVRSYQDSTPTDITVTGTFTANDIYEARYMLAMQTFFKVATKGDFGDIAVAKGTAGAPPPVLLFEYLGDHGFNKVPVVVTSFSMTYEDNVDYVPVVVNNTTTFVPTIATVLTTLSPQYTPSKVRRRFDVNAIANGEAYRDGFV